MRTPRYTTSWNELKKASWGLIEWNIEAILRFESGLWLRYNTNFYDPTSKTKVFNHAFRQAKSLTPNIAPCYGHL
jgi:hypothetical protein